MKVLKFGGTSVANAANIKKVMAIVNANAGDRVVVIVSALGGITDLLITAATLSETGDEKYNAAIEEIRYRHISTVKEIVPADRQTDVIDMVNGACKEIGEICRGIFLLKELSPRTKDRVMSYGEMLSSRVIHAAFGKENIEWADSRKLIVTDDHYGMAAVNFETTNKNISEYFALSKDDIFILPGFIASDRNNVTTTLGRGGSDYTAAIFAAATNASALEIWTDVSGMMTADPRAVTTAMRLPEISYREAMELSHFGAKVIYPPTVQPVMNKNIPILVKNTFAPEDEGTLIKNEPAPSNNIVRGISGINKLVLMSLEGSGMVGIPGFSKRLFEALASASVNVILITQASSEHSISVCVEAEQAARAQHAVDTAFQFEIRSGSIEPLRTEYDLSIVAIVGDNMKNHTGVSGKMFGALGRNGVNIRAIAQGSSERNISAVIRTEDVIKATNILHEEFFESGYKQVNIFIAGLGNVGKKLTDQLHNQKQFLRDHLRLQLRITGMANSRKMIFNEEGIDLSEATALLKVGADMDLGEFSNEIQKKNLRNTVFVDVTANDDVADIYSELLQKSISVVACNKAAASSTYENYKKLKTNAHEFNSLFLFETNVGAGLPVIGTLNDLIRSGDKINKIEAVLSGTLNFVFNNYDGTKSFATIVKQAQDEGYTEPDPRLDLSGKDVMRKIMILAREAGEQIETEDISINSFMPASCMNGSVEDFYHAMEKEEAHFKKLYADASAAGKKLKFIASYSAEGANGFHASVGLQQVDPKSDFYHLYGKDNAVLFYTDRYPENPLVIKGAGAGAEVTASGVFADIIRAATI